MVKILSNGEIVPDDDPRAKRQQTTNRNNASSSSGSNSSNSRPVFNQQAGNQQHQEGQSVSVLTLANEKLLSFGIPRWSVGGLTVEPIISVALLVSLLFFGLPGILLVVILFVVSQLSRDGAAGGNWMERVKNIFMGGGGGGGRGRQGVNRNPNAGRPSTSGTGHRLGGDM